MTPVCIWFLYFLCMELCFAFSLLNMKEKTFCHIENACQFWELFSLIKIFVSTENGGMDRMAMLLRWKPHFSKLSCEKNLCNIIHYRNDYNINEISKEFYEICKFCQILQFACTKLLWHVCLFCMLAMLFFPSLGAETVENTRKLMALSGKVKPHDSKNPLPSLTSPNLSSACRRQPMSPRHARPPIHLTAESSSVISLSNIANRKPSRTGKIRYIHVICATTQVNQV